MGWISKAWDGIKTAGKKVFELGNAFSGSSLGGLVGDGLSSAAQIAAAKYGYDKSLEGIQQQNATALQIAQQANAMETANANAYNQSQQQIAAGANAASAQQALQQMQFQGFMSNTAHRREVEDLRLAGLNPILSGTGGMGASSPAGAMGQVAVPSQTKPSVHKASVANEGAAVSSAMDVFRTVANAMKTNADREYLREAKTPETIAEVKRKEAETGYIKGPKTDETETRSGANWHQARLNEEQAHQVRELVKLTKQQRMTQEVVTKIREFDKVGAEAAAKKALQEGKISESTFGIIMMHVDRFFEALPFSSGANVSKSYK